MSCKKSFTLIELIFVVIVIGIIGAVAIPKFKNLKQSAKVTSIITQTVEGAKSVVDGATIYKNLEDKIWDPHCNNIKYPDSARWKKYFCLKNLLVMKGNDWRYDMTTIAEYYSYPNLRYYIAMIELNKTSVIYRFNCNSRYLNSSERKKCISLLGGKEEEEVILNW